MNPNLGVRSKLKVSNVALLYHQLLILDVFPSYGLSQAPV